MKRLTTALVATALTSGLVASAPPASAASSCPDPTNPIESWTAVDVGVGTKKAVTVRLNVDTLRGCGIEDAVALLKGPRKSYRVKLEPSAPAEGHVAWNGSIRLDPRDLTNSEAGSWDLRYLVSGDDAKGSLQTVAQVRRATRISFNAGPEPVKNDKLTFSGTLERASWSSRRYLPVRKDVVVQTFDAGGEEPLDLVTVRTKKNGTFRTTIDFPGANKYWARFEGGAVSKPSESRADRVDAP